MNRQPVNKKSKFFHNSFLKILDVQRSLQRTFKMAFNMLESITRRNMENTDRIMKNAIGYVVSNNNLGITVQSSFDNSSATAITKLLAGSLVAAARSAVRDLDPTNDLAFLRVATRKFEYLVAPEKEFTIAVIQ